MKSRAAHVLRLAALIAVIATPAAVASAEPQPPPHLRPTRAAPLLGKASGVVAGPRSLADAARERTKKGGTVSQMDSSVEQYQYVPGAADKAPAPKAQNPGWTVAPVTVYGPSHGVPQVGMSIEEHRERAAAAAAPPTPAPARRK